MPKTPKLMSARSVSGDTKPLDAKVDAVFGEPVILRPMKTQSGGYRESVVDSDRVEVIATGIYDLTRGAVENAGSGGGSFNHALATVGISLSIREEPILQCELKKGDRVYFPERDETYEVTHIHADPGARPDVHLVRVIEEAL